MASPTGQKFNIVSKAWDLYGSERRIKRPNYYWADANTIRIDASSKNPVWFNINSKFYKVTSTLDLVLGGLVANTTYYIYAIISNGSVVLQQSTDAPSSGLDSFTYGNWSYVGGFSTQISSAAVLRFSSVNGAYLRYLASSTQGYSETSISYSQKDIKIPIHAARVALWCFLSGTLVTGASGLVSANGNSGTVVCESRETSTSGDNDRNWYHLQITNPSTLWLRSSNGTAQINAWVMGWTEDPMEYP